MMHGTVLMSLRSGQTERATQTAEEPKRRRGTTAEGVGAVLNRVAFLDSRFWREPRHAWLLHYYDPSATRSEARRHVQTRFDDLSSIVPNSPQISSYVKKMEAAKHSIACCIPID